MIAAKYVAAVTLSVAILAVGLVMAAGATAIGGLVHGDASFVGPPRATSAPPSSSWCCR